MRNIVLILILVNLVFAAWFWRTVDSPELTVERTRDDAVLPPIVLVSEAGVEQPQPITVEPDYEELQQPNVQFAIPEIDDPAGATSQDPVTAAFCLTASANSGMLRSNETISCIFFGRFFAKRALR